MGSCGFLAPLDPAVPGPVCTGCKGSCNNRPSDGSRLFVPWAVQNVQEVE